MGCIKLGIPKPQDLRKKQAVAAAGQSQLMRMYEAGQVGKSHENPMEMEVSLQRSANIKCLYIYIYIYICFFAAID